MPLMNGVCQGQHTIWSVFVQCLLKRMKFAQLKMILIRKFILFQVVRWPRLFSFDHSKHSRRINYTEQDMDAILKTRLT